MSFSSMILSTLFEVYVVSSATLVICLTFSAYNIKNTLKVQLTHFVYLVLSELNAEIVGTSSSNNISEKPTFTTLPISFLLFLTVTSGYILYYWG